MKRLSFRDPVGVLAVVAFALAVQGLPPGLALPWPERVYVGLLLVVGLLAGLQWLRETE